MRMFLVYVAALAAAFFVATACHAAPQCGPLDQFIKVAAEKYEEVPVVVGFGTPDERLPQGHLLIILASPTGGWTALAVTPDKNACVVDSGEGLQITAPSVEGSF